MKIKYSILILSSILTFTHSVSTFWAEEICAGQGWFALYTCRSENICKKYTSEKPTYNVEPFQDAWDTSSEFQNNVSDAPALDRAKNLYRENIGNIYKCAIIQSQINSIDFLSKQLKQESSGQLQDSIGWQLKIRLQRLEISANTVWCTLSDAQSIQNKLNILNETTTQLCEYVSYLEYLKSYYEQLDRFWNEAEMQKSYGTDIKLDENYTITQLPEVVNSVDRQIAEEIAHSYKVFPVAYDAYSQYENNFPIHFLLEVIHADVLLLKTRLYETLMPIAQLWLKVINAMSY